MFRSLLLFVTFSVYHMLFGETVAWSIPPLGVVKNKEAGSFVLQENHKVKIPITLSYAEQELLALGGEGNYSFALKGVSWIGKGVSIHSFESEQETENESESFKVNAQKPKGAILIERSITTPKGLCVLAGEGTGGYNHLHVLDVSLKRNPAFKDASRVEISRLEMGCFSSGGARVTKAYLYSGEKELDTALVQDGKAIFSNIDKSLPALNAKTFSVYLDIRDAKPEYSAIHVVLSGVSGTSSSRIVSLPIASETFLVTSVGPKVSVMSQPKIVCTDTKQGRMVSVLFDLEIEACGGDVEFGPQILYNTFQFSVLRNGKVLR